MFRACVTRLAIIKKLIFPGPNRQSEENARHAVSGDPISRPMTAARRKNGVHIRRALQTPFFFFPSLFSLSKNEFSSFVLIRSYREKERDIGKRKRRLKKGGNIF